MNPKDLGRAAKALLNAGKLPSHKRTTPTKDDLKRKFVMRAGKDGKPKIKEVK